MHVVFSHGLESGPWGGKICHLAEIAGILGCTVESLDYQGISSLRQRVTILSDYLQASCTTDLKRVILVGSSMGACVSIAAARVNPVAGLFLLAPAFGLFDELSMDLHPNAGKAEVVHGWHDELISAEKVFNWSLQHRCTLHLVNDSHRLLFTLPEIGSWLREFIRAASVMNSTGISQ